jgi:RHS repeat-associated protein
MNFDGVQLTGAPQPNYYVEDLLGSSRVVTNSSGAVCYDADFYPYGGERAYTNTCAPNYKFESKERDTETGNDDFGARYYSNRFGRWLSTDWSSVPVPVPYANLSNPQTLNLYAMVSDDPESFADLDGHCEIICVIVVAVALELASIGGTKAYYSYKETTANAQAKNEELKLAQMVATNPNGPATSQVDVNNLATSYAHDNAATMQAGLQTATQANSAANMAISAAGTAVTGGPNPSSATPNVDKAVGAGIKAGKTVVSNVTNSTEQKPAQGQTSQQQTGQEQKPSVWQGLKSLFSATPPPPRPPAPKPVCTQNANGSC